MINDVVYLFNMNGEKLFNMERAYRTICHSKVEDIINSGIISDESAFRQYATSGHNPRKFGITQIQEGTFDSSDSENVNRIVKFLCKKGMIDPVNDDPVEVEGARQWM